MEDENAIEEAQQLFESGAEVVYLAVLEHRVLVGRDPPNRPGVIVTARSIHEVRNFVRDLKLERR